jgi:LacI family transcriptional regulator
MAVGVLRVLWERNVSVPQAISDVGFDDIQLAEFANPPLSTVKRSPRGSLARDLEEPGRAARRHDEPNVRAHPDFYEIVRRQSTAPSPDAHSLLRAKID